MRATWVTIHHEGGGGPTDRVSRFLNAARYSAGIGITRYELVRAPEQSFTTKGQTGKCLQICLSGHRGRYPVSDSDLALIHACCDEARSKDWLTLNPACHLHGDTMATDCPGDFTEARRGDLEYAVRALIPAVAPSPPVTAMGDDDEMPSGAQQMVWNKAGDGYWIVGSDGGVFCYGTAGFFDSMGGKPMNAPIVGIAITPTEKGYTLLGQDGGTFHFGDAVMLGAPTGQIR